MIPRIGTHDTFLSFLGLTVFKLLCSVSQLVSQRQFIHVPVHANQRWSRGHKARGQGQGHKKNPRPRTAFPRTDTLEAKDRNARGQGQGPRTQSASALQKKKKGLHKNFSGDLQKKKKKKKKKGLHRNFSIFQENFSTAPQNFNFPKNSAVLEPRTGQFLRT